MIRHLSLPRTGRSVIQQPKVKCQNFQKYTCSLRPEKCEQSSYLSNADVDYDGTKNCLTNSHSGEFQRSTCSQIFGNFKGLFYKQPSIVTSVLSDSQVQHQPVIIKQQFHPPHAVKHFLYQMWSVQHLMYHKSDINCVRLFHSRSNEHSLSKVGFTAAGLQEKATMDKLLTENMATESKQLSGQAAAPMEKLSEEYVRVLAKILCCSEGDMNNLVSKYHFFTHLAPHLISRKVRIMLKFGLPPAFITQHPRLLYQTSGEELQRRLQKFKDNSFLTDNSVVSLDSLGHYLECTNGHFFHTFNKLCAERDSLEGCYDKLAYIQFRLKCPKTTAQEFLSSYPLKRNLSNVRLKKLLDFLLNEAQFSAQFVITHRKLLNYSVERLRERWNVCQSAGIKSESQMINIFDMAEKDFEAMYGGLSAGA